MTLLGRDEEEVKMIVLNAGRKRRTAAFRNGDKKGGITSSEEKRRNAKGAKIAEERKHAHTNLAERFVRLSYRRRIGTVKLIK